MTIDVLLLPQGGTSYLKEIQPWRESGAFDLHVEAWEECVLKLASMARSYQQAQVEIFLCLRRDHLFGIYDYHFLGRLLNKARSSVGLLDTYVVVNRDIGLRPEQVEAAASLSYWFETVFNERATDVIEVEMERYGTEMVTPETLRIASDSSRERRLIINEPTYNFQWQCAVNATSRLLASFLGKFVVRPSNTTDRRGLLIVVERSSSRAQVKFVSEMLAAFPNSIPLVALFKVSPSAPLIRLCEERGIPLPLRFHGPFELKYFLYRLNSLLPMQSTVSTSNLIAVPIDPQPVFSQHNTQSAPRIFFTCSFDPDEERLQCFEAANDIGYISVGLPLNIETQQERAISCERIVDIINTSSPLTAWVHIGLGDEAKGLRECYLDSNYKSPDEWLKAFSAYKGKLPLAFFSSAGSTTIARRFAAAGTCVAIGFEGEVTPEPCRILAKEVVHAAVRSQGNQKEILTAFDNGVTKLAAAGFSASGATAFYAKQSQG